MVWKILKSARTGLWKKFDKSIYRGAWAQYIWLCGLLLFVWFVLQYISSRYYPNICNWRVVELLLDPGSFVDAYKKEGTTPFQLITTLIGAVFFTGLLISTVGNTLERRIDRFRNGNVAYEVDDHILIIGAGSMLTNLIKTLLEEKENLKRDIVILTSKDAEEVRAHIFSEIPKEKSRNIYVYYGSRVRKDTLNKLEAYQTTAIYILGEDDEPAHDSVNMKCYELLKEVCSRSKRIIYCYMVLDRLTSIQLFYYNPQNPSTDKLRLTVVNSLESAAQRILVSNEYRAGERYPTLDRSGIHVDDNKFVHFVIVGMSPMGYAMATTAAHVCHFPNFQSKGLRTKITFIQNDIRQEMNFFLGRFSELMKLSYWQYNNPENPMLSTESFPDAEYADLDSDPKGFLDIEWEFIDGGIETPQVRSYLEKCAIRNEETEVLTIALCDNEPETNTSMALFLPSIISEKQIPVFVYQPGGDQMIRTVKDTVLYAHLYPFGIRANPFDRQYRQRVRQAQRIKYLYDMGKNFTCMPENSDELIDKWFNDQYVFQQSNLCAANSIPFKKRSISIGERKELNDEEVNLLAETEHNRWNIERLLLGFKPYKIAEREDLKLNGDKNINIYFNKEKLLIHKDIAPYKDLINIKGNSEETDIKEIDKIIVRNILKVL